MEIVNACMAWAVLSVIDNFVRIVHPKGDFRVTHLKYSILNVNVGFDVK
jgi:hypothetical protein